MQVVILAGGKGTRLKPFTTHIPKPLVPIDDLPILEVVLRQLKHHGFTDIILAVNHLAELIMAFFGNGDKLGLNITYCREDHPLGTAGCLSIMEGLHDQFIVMNGDLLTTLNYQNLYNNHSNEQNDITICSYPKKVPIDLGILKIEDHLLVDYIEKPTMSFDISMGIYMMQKEVLQLLQPNQHMDMPTFILKAKHSEKKIGIFQESCLWLDIGRVDDYETAVDLFCQNRSQFLPS